MPSALVPKFYQSHDDVRLAYYAAARPRPDAPTVVLANGLGGPKSAWKALVEYLGDRVQFITWDYRGLYGSARPRSLTGYRIDHHVRDLFGILDREGVPRAAIVGWSMGVQVAIEAALLRPDRTKALVLMNGTAGRPLDSVLPVPRLGSVLGAGIRGLGRAHRPVETVLRALARDPRFVDWLKRAGLIGKSLERQDFAELVQAFGTLDMHAFFANLAALGQHDARHALGRIQAPALVVAGTDDAMTKAGLAQQMARRIRRAETLVVHGATHYTAVEYPDLVNLRIEQFFETVGVLPQASAA